VDPWFPVRNDAAAAPAIIKPRRAAIYVRVSAADESCEMQLRKLQVCAVQHEWPVVGV